MADLRACVSPRMVSAIPVTDVSVYSGAAVRNLDTGKDELCTLERTLTIHVVLGDGKAADLEPLYEQLLASLDRGLRCAGHYVSIELGEAGWVDEKDSLLKAKIAVETPVIFKGGVYRPMRMAQVEAITIERDDMNGSQGNDPGFPAPADG